MSVHLWKVIFETASQEEIMYILRETSLSIPGFRVDSLKNVHRTLITKTMVQMKNRKKIRGAYQKILDLKLQNELEIKDEIREKIIQLLIMGDIDSLNKAEELALQLISKVTPELAHDELQIEIIEKDVDKSINTEWQNKYKALEKKMHGLELKYDNKVNEVNKINKKMAIIEKKYKTEIIKFQEKIKKISEEMIFHKKYAEKLNGEKNILEEKNQTQIEKNEILAKQNNEYEEKNIILKKELEELLLNNNSDKTNEDNVLKIGNKLNVLVIGEKFCRQEWLKEIGVEFMHAQEVATEEIEKRSEMVKDVILLSWTMTTAMQRKIKKVIANSKLNEFNDYCSFEEYINKGDISYVSN